jgi:hypothetical protein
MGKGKEDKGRGKGQRGVVLIERDREDTGTRGSS